MDSTAALQHLIDEAQRLPNTTPRDVMRFAIAGYLIGALKHLPGQHDQNTHGHRGIGESSSADSISSTVENEIGVKPDIKEMKVMGDESFNSMLKENDADLFANSTAAIAFPDGRIYIREGYVDSALHEVIHRAGFMPDGINVQLNEGITQAAAINIAGKTGMSIRSGYDDQVASIDKYVIPLTGLSRDEFFKGYAKADNKSKWISEKITKRHADKFKPEDWSRDIRSRVGLEFERALGQGFADNDYARYLVDELGVT